jgi:cholesterol transport system auxiliary component
LTHPGQSRRSLTAGFAWLAALTLALVPALMVSGCGGAEPVRPDRFFRLQPVPLVGPAGPPSAAILLVHDLAARGFLGGRPIVFRTREEPLVVQRYDTLLWEVPPPRAVADALVESIRAAGVFSHVVIPAERARADFLLGGEVQRFEHLPTDDPPRVAVTLNLALVRANDRSSMSSRQYSGEEMVDAQTPEAMADAFNRLTARLLAEAARDLQKIQSRLTP